MSYTFKVDNVSMGRPRTPLDSQVAFQALAGGSEFEAQSSSNPHIVQAFAGIHPFVAAIHHAYNDHLPLAFGPDHVWLTILQGVALHIDQDPEGLRPQFVEHRGQKIIKIIRDAFVKGNPNNNWAGAFAEFSEKIKDIIGKKHDLLVPRFSTTGELETATFNVSLMNAMKYYFEYRVMTRCGFPQITLEGSTEDWYSIKNRVMALSELGLQWWTDELLPVVDQLIATSEGNPDQEFWHLLYKDSHGSGGPYTKGWINTLFPYLQNNRGQDVEIKRNTSMDQWRKNYSQNFGGGPQPGAYGKGLSSTPFIWEYCQTEIPMEIVTGFSGVEQTPEGILRPAFGWGVREKNNEI